MAKKIFLALFVSTFLVAGISFAHTPLCSCYDNGDGTIECEGGFSDGSTASGVEMRVIDKKKNVLIKGKMDEDSVFIFDKPSTDYTVIFDAGDGHEVEVDSKEITE